VKIDRTKIELNETFTLTFEASESPDDDPDFSPLEKDFQVISKSSSSNMSIINGAYSRTKKWNVTLIALRTGTLTIPQINFGSDTSPSYQVDIKLPQKSSGKTGESFISELEISTSTTYPQAQIIVTQRLLSSSNINAYEFTPLKLNGVEVTSETLGDVKQFQVTRGDTPYLVLEQNYAIYPQSAGTLSIQPSVASARIAIQGSNRGRSAYDPFRSNTKTLRRSSEGKTITVKTMPTAFKGRHWLAAKEVQLVEDFPQGKTFKAGEPITRTLSLLADGQLSSQLPEFKTEEISGLKQYPDKPLLKNNVSDDGITGVQQLKVAIIPSAAGTYTLPEISIPWWNTQTNKLEVARIKSRRFNVSGSAANNVIATPPRMDTDTTAAINDITGNGQEPTTELKPLSNESSTDTLLWKLISLFLAVGLSITLFLLWRKKDNKPSATNTENTTPVKESASVKQALKQLHSACESNNAQASKDALLLWAQALFAPQQIHSLGDMTGLLDDALAEIVNKLNACLYRDDAAKWTCASLYKQCHDFTASYKPATSANSNGSLESLYK